jgi:DNA-binding CsgD family transcriptional regulator
MKETIIKSFDLIICFEECGLMNGFQIYTILNTEIIKNEIPFIIVLSKYCKNKILIGIELGIDSFIFPSFNQKRILKVINIQLKKNKDRKRTEILKYTFLRNSIPYAVFVADNLKITEANQQFYQLIKTEKNENIEYFFRNIFIFNLKNNYELSFFRLVNGLEKNCTFKEVKIIGNDNTLFEVEFYLLNKRGFSYKVIGIIKPDSNDNLHKISNEKSENCTNDSIDKNVYATLFTNREREILKLSAIGKPIKQIAENLNISKRTVEKHRSNIISKTKAGNIVEAVFIYSKNIFKEELD